MTSHQPSGYDAVEGSRNMMVRHRLRSTLFNVLFASVGYVVLRMVMAPLRIKLLTSLLSKEDYGLLTLLMLTVSFTTLVLSLGSLEFMLRKLPGRHPMVQVRMLRTVSTYFGWLTAAVGFVAVLLLILWQPGKLGLGPMDVIAGGIILVVFMHLTQLVYFLIGRSQYAQSRALMLFYADAWFLPVLGFMWFVNISVSFMLWLWVAWLFLSLLLSQLFVKSRLILKVPASRKRLRDILCFGIPLMPMIMGEWIFQIQDRYVLLAYTDLEAVANYTLCFNLAWVGVVTGASMLDVLVTEFYKARNQIHSTDMNVLLNNVPLRRSFTLLMRYALILSVPVSMALWIAREPLILLLSDAKFADTIDLMRWVSPLPSFFLLSAIMGRALMAIDRGGVVGLGTLGAAVMHLTLNLILTPFLAERGAALAGSIAYAMLALYLGYQVRFFRWIDWPGLRPFRFLVFVSITGVGLRMSVQWLQSSHFLALLTAGLVSLSALIVLGLVRKGDLVQVMESMHTPPGKNRDSS